MGKGDKKSKRGKIIIGSFGVSRPRRKKKTVLPVVKKGAVKPQKPPKAVEEPLEVPVVAVEEPQVAAKKPAKKAPAKKAVAVEEVAKPKVAKSKKKAAAEGETLFSQPEETTPEK